MIDVTESPYYFIGAAWPQDNPVQYGLYEPITNRFVLVSQFLDSLKIVSQLFASRLSLRLCQLHCASNFEPSLIDNTCCTDWAIATPNSMTIARGIDDHISDDVHLVTELIPSVGLTEPELIVDGQEYLFAAYTWVTTNEKRFWNQSSTDPFTITEIALDRILELPLPVSQTTTDLKKVHNIIFTEFDFAIAEPKIKQIMTKYE